MSSRENEVVIVGAVAYDARVVTIWEKFLEYFDAAGVPTDYVLFSNYEAQVAAVLDGTVHIGWNTNTAYVQLNHQANGSTKILGMRDVDADFASVLVVRRGEPIAAPVDLVGRKFACGSSDAAHASILPLHYLKRDGLDVEQECDLTRFDIDIGKHGDTGASDLAVLKAVADGSVDAGVVGDAFLSSFKEAGEPSALEVEVAWRSPTYSHCNFTALDSLPTDLSDRWSSSLLSMSSSDPEMRAAMKLEGVRHWLPGDDDGYRDLCEVMESAGTVTLI